MYKTKQKNTLILIQDAINTINEDNRIVTKKELMELTGLSSGTFSKDYIKELLKENCVCQYTALKEYYELLKGKHQQILEYMDSIGENTVPYLKIL